jgi:hypothetical protein
MITRPSPILSTLDCLGVLAIIAGAIALKPAARDHTSTGEGRPPALRPWAASGAVSDRQPAEPAHAARVVAGTDARQPGILPTAAYRQLQARVEASRSREAVHAAFGPLIKQLGLDAPTAERLEDLVAQERQTAHNALAAAQAQGAQSYLDYKAAVDGAIGAQDQDISSLLGADGYAQFDAYRQTLPEQQTVAKLAAMLGDGTAPLSGSQQAQLVRLIDQMEPAAYRQNEAFLAVIGMADAPLNPAIVNAAQGLLSPPQLDAFQALQGAWLARAQLDQALRARQP